MRYGTTGARRIVVGTLLTAMLRWWRTCAAYVTKKVHGALALLGATELSDETFGGHRVLPGFPHMYNSLAQRVRAT